jgi:hypothetical protein
MAAATFSPTLHLTTVYAVTTTIHAETVAETVTAANTSPAAVAATTTSAIAAVSWGVTAALLSLPLLFLSSCYQLSYSANDETQK